MTDAELHRYMSEPRSLEELATTIGREWRARNVEDVREWAWNFANIVADKAEERGVSKEDAVEVGAQAAELAIQAFNAGAAQ